jgi:hypothetical protein
LLVTDQKGSFFPAHSPVKQWARRSERAEDTPANHFS